MQVSYKKLLVVFTLTFLSVTFVSAQGASLSSPFSYYGLGNTADNSFGRASFMGGLGASMQDSLNVNILNPASLSAIQNGTFHIGLDTEIKRLNSNDQMYGDGWMSHMSLAFPILKDRLSVAVSMLPFSSVGYNILDNSNISEALAEQYTYHGVGDVYHYNVAFGYRVFGNKKHSLNIGTSFSNIRGVITRYDSLSVQGDYALTFKEIYPSPNMNPEFVKDSEGNYTGVVDLNLDTAGTPKIIDTIRTRVNNNAFAVKNSVREVFRGFYTVFGLQYQRVYAEDDDAKYSYNFGLNLNGSSSLDATKSIRRIQYLSNSGSSSYAVDADTLADQVGTIELPKSFAVGLSFKKESKRELESSGDYEFGIEYRKKYWSEYRAYGIKDAAIGDDYMVILGGEYLPKKMMHKKSMAYRFGAYYGADRLSINNQQVMTMGIRFGVGLPLKSLNRSVPNRSKVNLGIEIGQRGAKNVLYEQYIRGTVSFTLNSKWFVKKKFL